MRNLPCACELRSEREVAGHIAAVLVIFLLLVLGGYHFKVTPDKSKGEKSPKTHGPRVTHSSKP